MKPGIYDNISSGAYHGGDGVSKSGLDLVRKSPMHYKAARDAANDNKGDTKAYFVGREFHSLVLEPSEFVKEYCLAFRQQDMPEAIDDRNQLVAMVDELNSTRLAKLPTSGSKAEIIERIQRAWQDDDNATITHTPEQLEALKGAELKAVIDGLNTGRQGLLSTSGTRHELAAILRANGRQVTLWSDVKAEWEAVNGHRRILTPDEWDQVHRMRDAVMAHPSAAALLTGVRGFAELSAYWVDPVTGELCRCRPDFWRMDGIVVDVKTTEDASKEAFARSISNYRYYVQHPYYLDGLTHTLQQMDAQTCAHPVKANKFVFIAVEKKPPYAVETYMLDPDSVEAGREEYIEDLNAYAHARSTGQWPGYSDGKVQQISLPDWKLRRLLDAA